MKIRSLAPGARDYPAALYALEDPPTLRVLGVYDTSRPCVTVVGTRTPTEEGYAFAFQLGAALARAEVTVVSGGAVGIDAAAHRGALAAAGSTVAFTGCGLASIQTQHRDLFRSIVEGGGALVSPFKDDTVARRHHFFRRNELMALVGRSTILVECGVRSGARNTMKHARDHERPRGAVPHAPWTRGVGTGLELRMGASVLLSAADALRISGVSSAEEDGDVTVEVITGATHDERRKPARARRRPRSPRPLTLALSSSARAVLRALSRGGPLTTEELAEAASVRVGDLAMELLQLEVEGVVRFGAGGYELTEAFDVSKAWTDG